MSEWRESTLGAVCEEGGGFIRTGPFGSQLHQSDYVSDPAGIPVVMPKDINGGRIDRSSIARVAQGTADRLSHHLLAVGDIVLSRRGDVGRSAWVAPEDPPVLCGTGSMRIHPGDGSIDRGYLRYFMRSRAAIDFLEGRAIGATMPNLNASIVSSLPITVLPRRQQVLAAEVLGTLDDLIENNRRRIALLDQMAQAVYREWFVRFRFPGHEDATFVDTPLGPIPAGWETKKLFDLVDLGFGFSYKSKRFSTSGPFPVIRIRDIPAGVTKTFSDEPASERYRVIDGDVLIGMDGDFHMRQWAGGEAWLNQRVARLRPLRGLAALHLMLALEEPIRRWNRAIIGTTVAHLGKSHLEQIALVVPPSSLLRKAAELFNGVAGQTRTLQQASQSLAAIRNLLLPKLVTGQIDVSHLDLDTMESSVA